MRTARRQDCSTSSIRKWSYWLEVPLEENWCPVRAVRPGVEGSTVATDSPARKTSAPVRVASTRISCQARWGALPAGAILVQVSVSYEYQPMLPSAPMLRW